MIRLQDERAFTVIEVLVALALLLVALAMFSGSLVVAERSAGRQMEQGQTLNQLRTAITTLDAELRSGFVASVSPDHLTATIYTEMRGKPECVGWRLAPADPPSSPRSRAGRQTLYRATWNPGAAAPAASSDLWRVVAWGFRNGQLAKNASTFTMTVPTGAAGGTAIGLQFWILTRDEPSPAAVAQGATVVATSLSARNAPLAALKNRSGLSIATACPS